MTTKRELEEAIDSSDLVCGKCGLKKCRCFHSDDRGIIVPPTSKAYILALKLCYADLWKHVK